MRRRSAPTLLLCLLTLLALPASAHAVTFNKAVDQLVRNGYPQRLETAITNFRSTPLGFRWTGSPADNAAARYIAAQMRAAGLVNVRLQAVPVDAWTFEAAAVRVGGRSMAASSYPGVPPTPWAGVTGQVVQIPNGGSAADFAAAGDIVGKIALVNFDSADWWLNFVGAEAALRGAKAVILIYSADYPGYHGAPNAFGSNDPGYAFSSAPIVWLPSKSADYLKAHLPTAATVTLRSRFTLSADGGKGYNVVGEYPGTGHDGKAIIIGSHHDSHFTGAVDNTSAVVAGLTIAKAMKASGFKPAHKIIFFSTTAEEWGYTNCNYDWLVGSTYSVTHTNAAWAGKVLAMLNMELQGYKNGSLWYTATPELKPWIEAEMAAHPSLVGPGPNAVYTPDDPNNGLWFSYNDEWPLSARGIPSACAWTANDFFWQNYYHTNYDNVTQLSYPFLAKNIKFEFELARSIDRGLLPYDLSAQADTLATAAGAADFAGAGIDAATLSDFSDALANYQSAASEFDGLRALVPARDIANANLNLVAAEKTLNSNLLGLGVWDNTLYPFQQPMIDLTGLEGTLAALSADPVDYDTALTDLGGVGLAWYGISFSRPVYLTNLRQRAPSYYHANMAAIGHMPWLVDVMPDYNAIQDAQSGSVAPAPAAIITSLTAKIAREKADVAARLKTLTNALQSATDRIEAITPPSAT